MNGATARSEASASKAVYSGQRSIARLIAFPRGGGHLLGELPPGMILSDVGPDADTGGGRLETPGQRGSGLAHSWLLDGDHEAS
jgi:hypothetical protein